MKPVALNPEAHELVCDKPYKVVICENINIAYVDFHIPGCTQYESA